MEGCLPVLNNNELLFLKVMEEKHPVACMSENMIQVISFYSGPSLEDSRFPLSFKCAGEKCGVVLGAQKPSKKWLWV